MNHIYDINPKSYYGLALDEDLIDDKRQEKWQKERLEKGFDDTEIWSLDSTIIKFIVPRLKAYLEEDKKLRSLENHCWTDKEKEEIKSYQKEICEMINVFEKYKPPLYNDNLIEFEKAFMKFAKIFPTLWT